MTYSQWFLLGLAQGGILTALGLYIFGWRPSSLIRDWPDTKELVKKQQALIDKLLSEERKKLFLHDD